ncbi:hypothetical protein P5V15_009772 [Pogonomyrmex californicus]
MKIKIYVRKDVLLLVFSVSSVLCNLGFINMGLILGYSSLSIPFVVIIIDCLLCLLTLKYGRYYTMIIIDIIFSLGWSLIASNYNVIQLLIGRTVTGIVMDLNTSCIQVYLEEISIFSWKEIISVTTHVASNSEILVVYLLGYIIQHDWRLVVAICIIPSVLSVLGVILFIYESPVWLLSKNQKEAVRIALLRIRQAYTMLLPEVWKPFVILILYFFFQQFSGLYVIVAYTVDTIVMVNIIVDPFLITVYIDILASITVTIGNLLNFTSLALYPMMVTQDKYIVIYFYYNIYYSHLFSDGCDAEDTRKNKNTDRRRI